jgi:hypothetical protein
MKFIYWLGIFFSLSFGLVIGFGVGKDMNKFTISSKPWFNIPKEVEKQLAERHVTISSGKLQGSGCRIKNGYYLTALHVLSEGIINKSPIAVGDLKATLVSHTTTDKDLAIVSTFAEIDENEAQLEIFNEFENNQDIIIVGSPGGIKAFVQPAKIIRDAVDDENNVKLDSKIISAQYIEGGISGGCVYSADGNKLLGIVTKKYGSTSAIGEASFASKRIE